MSNFKTCRNAVGFHVTSSLSYLHITIKKPNNSWTKINIKKRFTPSFIIFNNLSNNTTFILGVRCTLKTFQGCQRMTSLLTQRASLKRVLKSIASTMHSDINHNASLRSTWDHERLLYSLSREFKFWQRTTSTVKKQSLLQWIITHIIFWKPLISHGKDNRNRCQSCFPGILLCFLPKEFSSKMFFQHDLDR